MDKPVVVELLLMKSVHLFTKIKNESGVIDEIPYEWLANLLSLPICSMVKIVHGHFDLWIKKVTKIL